MLLFGGMLSPSFALLLVKVVCACSLSHMPSSTPRGMDYRRSILLIHENGLKSSFLLNFYLYIDIQMDSLISFSIAKPIL